MVQIVVTAEQARRLEQSHEAIEIVDEQGNRIGYYTQPFSAAEILDAKQRSAMEQGGRSTQEVLDRLSRLDPK